MGYDEYMDKECIEVCDLLNSYPGVKTFESCCGHLKNIMYLSFKCPAFGYFQQPRLRVVYGVSAGSYHY